MSYRNAAAGKKIGWFAALNPRFLADPSTLFLIAANLVPLYGVLFWGWNLYGLMVLYWMETSIIGFFAIVRMAMTAGFAAIILVPFFIVHFGGFMAGHIFFITALFGGGDRVGGPEHFLAIVWSAIVEHGLWIAFVALLVSHSISFTLNVWRPHRAEGRAQALQGARSPERPQAKDARAIMLAPYGRIVLMHVTIIFGAFLIQVFRTKLAAFVLLIALKIVFDVASHVRKNFSPVVLTTH